MLSLSKNFLLLLSKTSLSRRRSRTHSKPWRGGGGGRKSLGRPLASRSPEADLSEECTLLPPGALTDGAPSLAVASLPKTPSGRGELLREAAFFGRRVGEVSPSLSFFFPGTARPAPCWAIVVVLRLGSVPLSLLADGEKSIPVFWR